MPCLILIKSHQLKTIDMICTIDASFPDSSKKISIQGNAKTLFPWIVVWYKMGINRKVT
jgi:hypothetical protein